MLPAELVLFKDSGKQVLFTSLLLLASEVLFRSLVLLDEGPAGWLPGSCGLVAPQHVLSSVYFSFTLATCSAESWSLIFDAITGFCFGQVCLSAVR